MVVGYFEARKMDQKEFYNFLQRQQDFVDESKQLERAELREVGKKMLNLANQEAAKMKMTLAEFVKWMENSPEGKGYAKLIEQFKECSK